MRVKDLRAMHHHGEHKLLVKVLHKIHSMHDQMDALTSKVGAQVPNSPHESICFGVHVNPYASVSPLFFRDRELKEVS